MRSNSWSNSSGGEKRSGSERQRSACSSNPSDPNSGSANWLVSQGLIFRFQQEFPSHFGRITACCSACHESDESEGGHRLSRCLKPCVPALLAIRQHAQQDAARCATVALFATASKGLLTWQG